uniref:Uncharacterized protein n=2 Tax=Anguilla anguilla TaxID=7936 RepID=A0A0E9QXF5_ANGAN
MIGCCMSVRVLGQEAAEGWFKAGCGDRTACWLPLVPKKEC